MIGYQARTKSIELKNGLEYENMCRHLREHTNIITGIYAEIKTNSLNELCVIAKAQIANKIRDNAYISNIIESWPVWYKGQDATKQIYEEAFDESLDILYNLLLHMEVNDPGQLVSKSHIMPEHRDFFAYGDGNE